MAVMTTLPNTLEIPATFPKLPASLARQRKAC